jgi:hypothetical protein
MLDARENNCPACCEECKPDEELVYSGTTPMHKRCYEKEFGLVQPEPPKKSE